MRWLVALDESECSERIIGWMRAFPHSKQTGVTVVHVLAPLEVPESIGVSGQRLLLQQQRPDPVAEALHALLVGVVVHAADEADRVGVVRRVGRFEVGGVDAGDRDADAELRLYRVLEARYGDGAHSRYNALIRRILERGMPHAAAIVIAPSIGSWCAARPR